MRPSERLDIQKISKSYGGVRALEEVQFSIAPGEVHALCGENGAGKSTLIKVISGSVRPDAGNIFFEGKHLPPGDTRLAEEAGIVVIHQESSAFLNLTVEENIVVGREPRRCFGMMLDRKSMRQRALATLERLGEHIDPRQTLEELPIAQRQMVGIARALSSHCRLLIMDEPTASLSEKETQTLFRIIRQLRGDGVSIIYVSHRLEEVFVLADRITVLRDGRWIITQPASKLNHHQLVQHMVGRSIDTESLGPKSRPSVGAVALEVKKLCRRPAFEGISFNIHAGEIVGMAGLVGAGRSEIAKSLFGIDRADSGEIWVRGMPLGHGSIRNAMKMGLSYLPEDRHHLGLHLRLSVGENISMTVLRQLARVGLILSNRYRQLTGSLIESLHIRPANAKMAVEHLSGGNQQKVMLGKWLAPAPKILLLDEPTRGIDVGAKAEVHQILLELAKQGMATLLISSELPELIRICDRILVVRQGRIVGELDRERATQEALLKLALPVH